MKIKWFKRVFNRNMLILLLLAVQALFILTFFFKMHEYSNVVYGVQTTVSIIFVARVINQEDTNPAYKLSWTIIIMLIPIVGAFLYLFFHSQLGTTAFFKKKNLIRKLTRQLIPQDYGVINELKTSNINAGRLAKYINERGGYPVYKNTELRYFKSGEDKFKALLMELRKAKKYIFIEYFIVDEGKTLSLVLDILEEKVREGVEVRMMYDGMGTQIHRHHRFKKMIESRGIICRVFNEFRPLLTSVQNNRDHRKIVSIDGITAFSGGINIADEYVNITQRFGHWKDTAVMVKGEAAWSFTVMFIQMWEYRKREPADYARYMPGPFPEPEIHDGYIQPYGDGPADNERTGEMVYMDIINKARNYVYITTPYLIIDNEMITALTFAAKSGVDVKIIVPHIPDKKYVNIVGWNYYSELIKCGVKVYEYMPGFIHAKNFVSDDEVAVVGTINLDYRSLYLHFECAAIMYDTSVTDDIKLDFMNTLAKSREITLRDCENRPLLMKIAGGFLRMIAPLL